MLKKLLRKVGWGVRVSNLDELPGEQRATGNVAMHGRAWFKPLDAKGEETWGRLCANVCWNLRSRFCHAYVHVDGGERDITFGIGLPPVALWFTLDHVPDVVFRKLNVDFASRRELDGVYEREIGVSVHDWALWWRLWMPTMQSSSRDARWRRGNINLLDTLFGDQSYEKVPVSTENVVVAMPEKVYPAKVTISRRTWKRDRWPFTFGPEILFYQGLGYEIEVEGGVPVPGKGENSWDCEDDAIFSQSGRGGVESAISGLVESATRQRRRHGGRDWLPPAPTPVAQA